MRIQPVSATRLEKLPKFFPRWYEEFVPAWLASLCGPLWGSDTLGRFLIDNFSKIGARPTGAAFASI